MRLMLDTLVAVVLVGALGGLLWQQRAKADHLERVTQVQQAIGAIASEALYRAAVGDVEATPHGYAAWIDARWFQRLPRNMLLNPPATHWLDHVEEGGHAAFNPSRIVAGDDDDSGEAAAAFWYNPRRGIVRARVPMQFSQRATVELYNLVNGTSVDVKDVDWATPVTAEPTEEEAEPADERERLRR